MHRIRLLFLLGLVLALGAASVAKGQDGTSVFSKGRNQDTDSKHDKAKNKNKDGHRKHWWSPPRLHKKYGSDSAAGRTGTNSSSKTVAAKPMNKTPVSTNPGNKTAAAPKPPQKTPATTRHSAARPTTPL